MVWNLYRDGYSGTRRRCSGASGQESSCSSSDEDSLLLAPLFSLPSQIQTEKATVTSSCNWVTCRSSNTSSVLLWSTNETLVSELGCLWPWCWSCRGSFPVDPCYRRLHHGQGAKIVFYGLDQQIFWSSLIKAQHKVIFGCQFQPLPDFAEFRETLKGAPDLAWYQRAEEGGGRGDTGEAQLWQHQALPVEPRQMWLRVSCRNRLQVAQAGLQGAPWAKPLWFNEWGSARLPGQWAWCGERGIAELLEKDRIPPKSAGVKAARKALDALH